MEEGVCAAHGPGEGMGEQRGVQEGSCPAVGLCGFTVCCTFGDHGMVELDVRCCACRVRRALSHRAGAACHVQGGKVGGITLFSHSVCSCTPPWHRRPGPPCFCPAVRHRLISPGARSRCADALVPASNSQPLVLAAAFLEQWRRGWSSQDCLM